MSYFEATGTPVLDFLPLDVKARMLCFIHIVKTNIMYISGDPPLIRHTVKFFMVTIVGQQQVHILPKDSTV